MLTNIKFKGIIFPAILFGLAFVFPSLFLSEFASAYTLSVTYSGAQSISAKPQGDNTGTAISEDAITVATTCRNGYNFTISTSVNDNNLYLNGFDSNNTTGTYFSPSDGSTALSSAPNTWGYYYNANSVAPSSSSIFNPVPVIGNPSIIKSELATPSPTDISDSFSIYYGVAVSSSMAPGTYKMAVDQEGTTGTIVYNVTMADACLKYTVHFNPTSTAGGSTISGTGTMSDQSIYEGVSTALNPNSFTAPVGYKFKEWNTAQDGTGTSYTDEASVTDLAAVGGSTTLYAQWEGDIYTLDYHKNGDDVVGAGAYGYTFQYKGGFDWDPSVTSASLRAQNFKRDGYGFAGWSTDPNVASHINDNTHSYIYGPEEKIYTSDYNLVSYADVNNQIPLYAVWIPSAGDLQGWSGCSTLGKGNVTALTDTRDGQTYAVAKISDGNCWVIENYRLDPGTANITDLNTNQPASSFASMASGKSSATSSDWCTPGNASCMERILFSSENISGLSSKTNYGDARYGHGVYYNWFTATAGNGLFHIGSGSDESTVGDLCPAGWHIPTGGPNSDLSVLSASFLQFEDGMKFPNNIVLGGGIFESGTVTFRDGCSFLVSSTEASSQTLNAYNLFNDKSTFSNPSNTSFKGRGIPFRCMINS